MGYTPESRQVERSSRGAADTALCVDGPRVEEGLLKERDGGRCHSGYEQSHTDRRCERYELSVHASSL